MEITAIALGGFIGALLRYSAEYWLPWPASLPLGTLVINGLGCLFLGWLFAFPRRSRLAPYFRAGLGTGVLGAFTTFSAFSTETVQLFEGHEFAFAFLYMGLHVLGGLGLAALGSVLAHRKKEGRS